MYNLEDCFCSIDQVKKIASFVPSMCTCTSLSDWFVCLSVTPIPEDNILYLVMWPNLPVMWPNLSCDQFCLSCDHSACHVTKSACHVTVLSVMWPVLSVMWPILSVMWPILSVMWPFCLSCDCSVCHVTSSVHHVTNCLPDLQWCNLTCIMCPLQQDLCTMYMYMCTCFCSTRRSRPYLVWVNNTVYTYMYVSSVWKSGQMWDR